MDGFVNQRFTATATESEIAAERLRFYFLQTLRTTWGKLSVLASNSRLCFSQVENTCRCLAQVENTCANPGGVSSKIIFHFCVVIPDLPLLACIGVFAFYRSLPNSQCSFSAIKQL